jgi:hypothetical protein
VEWVKAVKLNDDRVKISNTFPQQVRLDKATRQIKKHKRIYEHKCHILANAHYLDYTHSHCSCLDIPSDTSEISKTSILCSEIIYEKLRFNFSRSEIKSGCSDWYDLYWALASDIQSGHAHRYSIHILCKNTFVDDVFTNNWLVQLYFDVLL